MSNVLQGMKVKDVGDLVISFPEITDVNNGEQ